MFKGLKSKLEDEAKKLQSTVQQYSEQISQQVGQYRSGNSEAGSDAGGSVSRRFGGGSSSTPTRSNDTSLQYSVGNALMEEVTEGDLLDLNITRERRLSGGSTHSNESSLSTMFQSVPGMTSFTLDTVDSDQESTADEHGSAVVRSASKEQITSVLSKLQGRAANYKDKYRDLVRKYNEVVTENNKCRTVLAQTQDKALNRIEKLRDEKKILSERLREIAEKEVGGGLSDGQLEAKVHRYEEMLEKCKIEITKKRAAIKELTTENEQLKKDLVGADGDADMTKLATERVAAEWKQRIDKVESEWTDRMNKIDSDHAILLATTKAEMHGALEIKDKDVEAWRAKCRTLEAQDGQANERWQKKVDDLQLIIQALETEKADMVEKLSAAKTQGVKAVRDEEELKREELINQYNEKEQKFLQEVEERLQTSLQEHNEKIEQLKYELESERSRCEANISSNGLIEESIRVKEKELQIEINELKEESAEREKRLKEQIKELEDALESAGQRQRDEISELIREHEEIMAATRKQNDQERSFATDKYEHACVEADSLRLKYEQLQQKIEEVTDNAADESNKRERVLLDQIEQLRSDLNTSIEISSNEREKECKEAKKDYAQLHEAYEEVKNELEQMKEQAEQTHCSSNRVVEELNGELNELRGMLEERNETVRRMQQEEHALQLELASAKELSAMHEHLRIELEEARKRRDEVEVMVLELTERAEKAEKTLQEDRANLEMDRSLLEESVEESRAKAQHGKEVLLDLIDSQATQQEEACLLDFGTSLQASTLPNISQDEVATLRKELERMQLHNEELLQKINELIHEKEDLETYKSAVSESSETSLRISSELASAQQSLSDVILEKNGVVKRLEELEAETQSVIREIEQRADTAENERINLDEELRRNKEETETVKMEKKELECDLLELQKKLADMQLQATFREEGLKEGVDAIQKKYEEELNVIRHARDSLEKELREAKEEKTILTEANEQMTLERTEFGVKSKQLHNQLEEITSSLKEESEKYSRLESERNELYRLLEETKEQLLQKEIDDRKRQDDIKLLESGLLSEKERVDELERHYMEKLTAAENETKKAVAAAEEKLEVLRADLQKKAETLRHEAEDEVRQQLDSSSATKISHLEEVCERMRVEFIAKEKVIGTLRDELDTEKTLRSKINSSLEEARKQIDEIMKKLAASGINEDEQAKQIESLRCEMIEKEKSHLEMKKNMEAEKAEDIKIREQYSMALENSKKDLEKTLDELKKANDKASEADTLKTKLNEISEELENAMQKKQQENEQTQAELKECFEKKMTKLKQAAEQEMSAAKAELLLQIAELQSAVSERERKLDAASIEKAKMEQSIISQEDMQVEIQQHKNMEKQLNNKLTELERLNMDYESENKLWTEKTAAMEKAKEELELTIEQKKALINDLQDKIKSLEAANEEGFRKAANKADADSKKVVRELQREVKQLYIELNEKTEALDAAEKKASNVAETVQKKTTVQSESVPQRDYMYEEELEVMRKKLADCHREIDSLNELNSRLERSNGTTSRKQMGSPSPAVIGVNGHGQNQNSYENPGFADPAEAEYLRNVLYRYMSERENLGKDSVTLARVIGTVAKFNKAQMDSVIASEEARLASWVGGTVSQVQHAFTGGR